MRNRNLLNLKIKSFFGLIAFLFFFIYSHAQSLDVAYVPTPDFVVERMLDMANVGPGDYVIDLGCGDGRINIAAAKRGAVGHGVDLDPDRIKEARKNATDAGVADKVAFVEQNIFDTDFSRANVIVMYLFPSINLKLRPSLLNNLEPGSRIVSHDFGMGDWKPDKQEGRMENHAVYLWIVPAKVKGSWSLEIDGEKYEMSISQEFQEIEIELASESSTFVVNDEMLSGQRISFTAANKSGHQKLVFSGEVEEKRMEGIVHIHNGDNKTVENWTAVME